MSDEAPTADNSLRKALFLPTLILLSFLVSTPLVFIGLDLVYMASSFDVPIGTASQLVMIDSLMGLLVAFSMSALVIRFKHKSLLLFGIAVYSVGMFGYFIAPNFATAIFSTVLVGVGDTIFAIMCPTIIGEQMPLERRGWAIGVTMSGWMSSWVIAAFLAGLITSIAGWRMVPLWFLIPLSLVSLVLGLVIIPSKQPQLQAENRFSYVQALKRIFMNRSPAACAVGYTFATFVGLVPTYTASFYIITYGVSPAVAGGIGAIGALGGVFGAAAAGRLVNRVGRKPLFVASYLVAAVCMILFTFMPILGVSVAVCAVSGTGALMGVTAILSLTLEQVPELKGSMMSIGNAFGSIGEIVSVIIGGLVLNLFFNNFHLIMTIGGAVAICGVGVVLLLAKDPVKAGSTR
jgi:predicted MFS family arabinose efflux permease